MFKPPAAEQPGRCRSTRIPLTPPRLRRPGSGKRDPAHIAAGNGPPGSEPTLATCRPWAGRLTGTCFANSDVLALPTDVLGVSGDLQVQAPAYEFEPKAVKPGV